MATNMMPYDPTKGAHLEPPPWQREMDQLRKRIEWLEKAAQKYPPGTPVERLMEWD